MKYVTTKIHNSSISDVKIFDDLEQAIDYAHLLYEEQFGYTMDKDDARRFYSDLVSYHEKDHDNHYTFSVNSVKVDQ